MKRYLAAMVAAVGLIGGTACAEDIIVESRPEGKNHDRYKETAGRWLDSNNPPQTAKSGAAGLTPQGTCGSRKYPMALPTGDPGSILASAKFSPKLTSPGKYNVYVTFPKAANATPVKYVIKHAKGEETKSIAQDGWGGVGNPNAGVWVSLGEYDFAAGDDQYVELQITGESGAPDPRTPGQAFADAVRFNSEPIPDAVPGRAGAAPTPRTGELAGTSLGASTGAASPTPAAAVVTPVPATDTVQLSWLEDIRAAQDMAGKSSKRIFVFFYSPESERSNNYDKKVFNDPKVKQALKQGYVLVRINIDENRTLANNLQVFRAGTINIYDERGNGINQFTETLDAAELASRLGGS